MPISNLLEEEVITLNVAATMFPRNAHGKYRHISQLYRHTTRGLRGVVLESLQCGSKRCTTREAVLRFITALTIQAGTTKASPPSVNPKLSQVDEELDRLGFGTSNKNNNRPKADDKRKAYQLSPITEQRLRDERLLPPDPP